MEEVSARSGIEPRAITNFERKISDLGTDAKRRLLNALELGGAVFIWENGGGVGVRLKYASRDVRAVNKWESEGGSVGEDDV